PAASSSPSLSTVVALLHTLPTRRSSDLIVGRRSPEVPTHDGLGARRANDDERGIESRSRSLRGFRALGRSLCLHGGCSVRRGPRDRKSTRLKSSQVKRTYGVVCFKKKSN